MKHWLPGMLLAGGMLFWLLLILAGLGHAAEFYAEPFAGLNVGQQALSVAGINSLSSNSTPAETFGLRLGALSEYYGIELELSHSNSPIPQTSVVTYPTPSSQPVLGRHLQSNKLMLWGLGHYKWFYGGPGFGLFRGHLGRDACAAGWCSNYYAGGVGDYNSTAYSLGYGFKFGVLLWEHLTGTFTFTEATYQYPGPGGIAGPGAVTLQGLGLKSTEASFTLGWRF